MKASANESPERLIKGKGITHYNYNIKQITVEEQDGTSHISYEYEYVEIRGKITRGRIIQALEDSKLDREEDFDPNEIESSYNAAKDAINLSEIATLTYEQLDTYIDNNVTNLAGAKTYLKKLSKVVLAIISQRRY